MSGDCRQCKDWRGCPGKVRTCPDCGSKATNEYKSCNTCQGTGYISEGYLYGEIQWCPQQNFWLLKFADILQGGDWPTPEIMADPSIRGKRAKTDAQFVSAVLAIAEVNKRLTQTGWRGRLLAEQCVNRETILDLDYDIRETLYYVSGWSRKERDFTAWRKDRRYRQKSDKKVVLVGT